MAHSAVKHSRFRPLAKNRCSLAIVVSASLPPTQRAALARDFRAPERDVAGRPFYRYRSLRLYAAKTHFVACRLRKWSPSK